VALNHQIEYDIQIKYKNVDYDLGTLYSSIIIQVKLI